MNNKAKEIDLHRLVVYPSHASQNDAKANLAPKVNLKDVSKRKTDDVYEHACNITAWQQLYDQLKPGQFVGELDEFWLEGGQFFKEYTNTALRQSCIVWPNSLWLGIPVNPQNTIGYIGSKEIAFDAIAISEGGKEFELNTPDDYTIMGAVVNLTMLREYISCLYKEQQDSLLLLLHHSTLEVNVLEKQRISKIILQALALGDQNPKLMTNPATRLTLQQDLFDSLAKLLLTAQQAGGKQHKTRANYQRIVSKARNYIIDNQQEIITVTTLCQYLNVSRRTLQNCFQTTLGISPYTYLRAIRLNAVRRELESSYSQHQTIQDAAMAWGFWHMSQFAADYHGLFGELPSKSLAARGRIEAQWQ